MAARTTRRTSRNGNLEAAMAMLIQNQAQFLIHLAETRKTFDRIEKDLDAIKAVLVRHEGILENCRKQSAKRSASNNKDKFRELATTTGGRHAWRDMTAGTSMIPSTAQHR